MDWAWETLPISVIFSYYCIHNWETYSRFYCPRPGLQSTKPNASVSRKLAIEMAIATAIGYSIRNHCEVDVER
ncbi:hypothetical protein QUB70_08925 [Microcoleus sp. A003_D6]